MLHGGEPKAGDKLICTKSYSYLGKLVEENEVFVVKSGPNPYDALTLIGVDDGEVVVLTDNNRDKFRVLSLEETHEPEDSKELFQASFVVRGKSSLTLNLEIDSDQLRDVIEALTCNL